MSRIGKAPVAIPSGVKVTSADGAVTVDGKLGKTVTRVPQGITVAIDGDTVNVTREGDQPRMRAFHGLTRALIASAVQGVTEGYKKELQIQGVGYRAQLKGKDLDLTLGFSHPVLFKVPQGITIEVPAPTTIVVKGHDKQQVGQVAAEIRKVRPPEPFKGKGVRYANEQVRRKAGKAGGK